MILSTDTDPTFWFEAVDQRGAILGAMARAEVIALFGPTGVGKTAVAVSLASKLRELGERPVAVSADALQVYAGLETLTGVAGAHERAALEHRLISFLPLDASFSAGQYAELAHAEIDSLLAAGRRPIVLGGTGLYLRAALTELSLKPAPAEGVRERWAGELERQGPAALHAQLAGRAPWAAAKIEPADRQRLVRALELLDAGELEPPEGPSELWTDSTRRPTLLVGLVMERAQLYARIDARVQGMLDAGVEHEVRAANAAGASITARKALGFEELLSGDVEGMKRRTRNYARRQLSWMRKLAALNQLDMTDRPPGAIAAQVRALWVAADPNHLDGIVEA
ncbi:MAG: tRNA (adenosine(37)-N6)-dimethylallyltransferase MiaA [Solirubrobacteraceae bacterium]